MQTTEAAPTLQRFRSKRRKTPSHPSSHSRCFLKPTVLWGLGMGLWTPSMMKELRTGICHKTRAVWAKYSFVGCISKCMGICYAPGTTVSIMWRLGGWRGCMHRDGEDFLRACQWAQKTLVCLHKPQKTTLVLVTSLLFWWGKTHREVNYLWGYSAALWPLIAKSWSCCSCTSGPLHLLLPPTVDHSWGIHKISHRIQEGVHPSRGVSGKPAQLGLCRTQSSLGSLCSFVSKQHRLPQAPLANKKQILISVYYLSWLQCGGTRPATWPWLLQCP